MGKVRRGLTSTFTSSVRFPRSSTSLTSSTNPSNRSFLTTYYYNQIGQFSFRMIICVSSSDSYWYEFPFPFWAIHVLADLWGTSLQMEIVEEPETAELGWVISRVLPLLRLYTNSVCFAMMLSYSVVFFLTVVGGVVHEKGLLPQPCQLREFCFPPASMFLLIIPCVGNLSLF